MIINFAIADIKPKYELIESQVEMEETVDTETNKSKAKDVKTPFYNPQRKMN